MFAHSTKDVKLSKLNRILSCAFLLLLMFVKAEATTSQPCVCNHGLVIEEAPHCVCHCFSKYLLPRCLYKETDSVPMEIWLRSAASDTIPLSGANIVAGLLSGFSRNPNDQTFVFQYSRYRREVDFFSSSSQGAPNSTMFAVMAVVEMPGWAAQHLLADVKHNNVKPYIMQNSFTGVLYNIFVVFDAMTGPARPRRYNEDFIAVYQREDAALFLDIRNLGWFFGALVLCMTLLIIERRCMFNVWPNVCVPSPQMHLRNISPLEKSGGEGRGGQSPGHTNSAARRNGEGPVGRHTARARKETRGTAKSHRHRKSRKALWGSVQVNANSAIPQ